MSLKNVGANSLFWGFKQDQIQVSSDFLNYMETIYLANINQQGSSDIDQFIQPWNVKNETLVLPKGASKKTKLQFQEASIRQQQDQQDKLLGQLSLNETDEILYLSSEEESYFKNHHTLKVNDINFEKMNEQANRNRYVVLGN